MRSLTSCFQWFKDTKMKANHNHYQLAHIYAHVVSNGSKILKWKQITTDWLTFWFLICCFQWFKDTKMKANHNYCSWRRYRSKVVSNGSKILKWKQITTEGAEVGVQTCCFQWFKDTKMKANHNHIPVRHLPVCVVSNGSKILKWKQITTVDGDVYMYIGCFQWFKDTKMKANHNTECEAHIIGEVVSNGSKILKWKQITTDEAQLTPVLPLFPMVQRY